MGRRAHYHALARMTGRSWREIADMIESAGIVSAFERGSLDERGFARTVGTLLDHDVLTEGEVESAWNEVVAEGALRDANPPA